MSATIPVQRGPAPRRWSWEDERIIIVESVRQNRQKRRSRRRFLIRRHTSAWCALFPNVPAWIVWDRDTDRMTPCATHAEAIEYASQVARADSHVSDVPDYIRRALLDSDTRPHHYVPDLGWQPIEEPSA